MRNPTTRSIGFVKILVLCDGSPLGRGTHMHISRREASWNLRKDSHAQVGLAAIDRPANPLVDFACKREIHQSSLGSTADIEAPRAILPGKCEDKSHDRGGTDRIVLQEAVEWVIDAGSPRGVVHCGDVSCRQD